METKTEKFTRYELKIHGVKGRDRKAKVHYEHGADLPKAEPAAGLEACQIQFEKLRPSFKTVERVDYAERPAERTTYPDGVSIVAVEYGCITAGFGWRPLPARVQVAV